MFNNNHCICENKHSVQYCHRAPCALICALRAVSCALLQLQMMRVVMVMYSLRLF
jgi:hypothetical protein